MPRKRDQRVLSTTSYQRGITLGSQLGLDIPRSLVAKALRPSISTLNYLKEEVVAELPVLLYSEINTAHWRLEICVKRVLKTRHSRLPPFT